MHELSIVMNIVGIAQEVVERERATQVDGIELEIGTLAGVELSALDFSWDMAVRHTVLEHAVRTVHEVQARARCAQCGHEFVLSRNFDPCPQCHEVLSALLCGRELNIKSLTIS